MGFNNKDFVHLHTHSAYSHFDGLSKLSDLVMTAREMGFPALALTDHGNIMGWINFLEECRKTKNKKGEDIPYKAIKPILGAEYYIARKMNIGQYGDRKKQKPKQVQSDGRKGNKHLNLYAMNFKGYQNLCVLSERSWIEGFYFDPRIDIELLDKYSEGVMGGSACLAGLINAHLINGNYAKAKEATGLFNEILHGNFFLEVMYHGIPEQGMIIPDIFKLSSELNIPVCCTNDVHFIKKEQFSSQQVLQCMSMNRCIKDIKKNYTFYRECYLKSAAEMAKIFGKNPSSLSNTISIAERIDTEDIEKKLFGGMRLPHFDIPEKYKNSFDYLSDLAWEGLKKVGWDKSSKHIEALKKELKDIKVAKEINNYDFATYFLIVRDYIQEAKKREVMVACGRGSGYASILLRTLGITYGLDPLKYGLLWPRFLGFDNKKFVMEKDFGFKIDES